ncbi:MAG: type I-E CRISPR-associated protein Cse2/CasB [Acidobacteriota bacterium]
MTDDRPQSPESTPADPEASSSGGPARSGSQRLQTTIRDLGRRIDAASDARYKRQAFRGGLDRGQVAELKRLDPRRETSGTEATFWRLLVDVLEPAGLVDLTGRAGDPMIDEPGEGRESLEIRHWKAILSGMATTAGLNGGRVPAGTAMHRADISEARFTKLLRATGDPLFGELRAVASQLRAAGKPFSWLQLAQLVLSERRPWADAVRRRLAIDYFNPRKPDDTTTDSESVTTSSSQGGTSA